MLRQAKELDFFRKLSPEHREASDAKASPFSVFLRALATVLIVILLLSETWTFMKPIPRQRFDIDQSETCAWVSAGSCFPVQKKFRVVLNMTIHEFPCLDISLDYQDVMGTRAVDVRTTIFKRRIGKDGLPVGEEENNNPVDQQGKGKQAANPSTKKRDANSTKPCGSCYGALPDDECCDTCADVLYAYRVKRWSLPRIESIEQCKNDGSAASAYQPPQIIRLEDYSYDDYLPKFTKVGRLQGASNYSEPHIATPFKLNISFPPLTPMKPRDQMSPFILNFTGTARKVPFYSRFDDWTYPYDSLDSMQGAKAKDWPGCIYRNTIIHGYDIGEALMVDLSPYGATTGCWNDDCTETDKYNCESMAKCAETCKKIDACHWWSHGEEDGHTKCWIRSGRNSRDRRYGFNSGAQSCYPNATNGTMAAGDAASKATVAASNATSTATTGNAIPSGGPPSRNLMAFDDDDGLFNGGGGYSLNFGPSPFTKMFGSSERDNLRRKRKEQQGESCQLYGYFDTNKVPGNFHIGTSGAGSPSYLSYFDEQQPNSNMRHTIHHLAFVEPSTNATLNQTQPLDGFESPKAFTFQYYLSITPATRRELSGSEVTGYQFKSGSFVTNELIGPAVFFRFDIDPIRVTYYWQTQKWPRFLVDACAIIGGCISMVSVIIRFADVIKD